jgi:uncharacterized protein (TIGR00255 family)
VLRSMTGYGEARQQGERFTLAIELRAVNGRSLKVTVRAPEPYHLLEPEFEKVIRKTVHRGTVHVQVRCERPAQPGDYRINAAALRSYVEQVRQVCHDLDAAALAPALLGQVLDLPGVVEEPLSAAERLSDDWPVFERVLEQALAQFNAMRAEEGRAMARELLALRDTVAHHLRQIQERLPLIVPAYRDRLLERVRSLLAEAGANLDADALIREVAIFAERSDVHEEVVRLASHLEQFAEIVQSGGDSPGSKLGFVQQEMGREANTLGSKANDVQVSRHVVEIKAALEKIKELIQNVE